MSALGECLYALSQWLIVAFSAPRNIRLDLLLHALLHVLFAVVSGIRHQRLGLPHHGLEVPVWIKQGLVDYLIVQIHMFGEHDGSAVQEKIREFTRLSAKSQTKVLVDVYPRRMPPRQYRKIATNYYDAGADGLAFWDSYNRYPRASEWAFLKRLGHRDDLARWLNKGDDYYRTVPIRRLDGTPMQREFSRPSDG